eukprot:GFUD01035903.1.p1 GENE.GFUD01035903.1~~GFUD01035903.1.p1  ORF type:complete len:442 (-),score=58.38 GFUD01035903.1:58-1383(-)
MGHQLTALVILLGLGYTTHSDALYLCGTNVTLSSDNWGVESEIFNVSVNFENVTQKTVFNLVPAWDKLAVSEDTFEVMEDSDFEVNMTAQHFYLYKVKMSCLNEESEEESAYFEVPVSRTKIDNTVALIFQRIMTVSLAFAMLLMGCELKFEVVRSYLVRPLAPAAGMFCQYVCMPVMAYVLGYFFMGDDIFARYGLILIGCSPGGSFSNFWAAIWGGDLDLSVTMTFCSTVASFGFTTFWVWLFGKYVLSSDRPIELPYLELFIGLVSLVVPVFIGLLITYKRPEFSAKLVKLSRPFFMVLMFIVTTLGTYTNRFFFSVVSWYHLVAPACLGIGGYAVGILFASILCLKKEQVIALSLETAIQNAGIAIMILQSNLASPYGDMALLPVLGYLFTASGPLNIIMYALYRLFTFVRDKLGGDEDETLGLKQVMAHDNKAYSK